MNGYASDRERRPASEQVIFSTWPKLKVENSVGFRDV